MLTSLFVRNYALLKNIELSFESGFTVITGETGAGKSILLGALGLVLGKRSDSSVLRDPNEKCVIEAVFTPAADVLLPTFAECNLEPEYPVIMRRIINPNGKSRLFLNETPINQEVAKAFGEKLIDIHSQHQNLLLKNSAYRLRLLDLFAGNLSALKQFSAQFQRFQALKVKLLEMTKRREEMLKQQDFHQFLYDQLEQAQLKEGEQEQLEQEIELLSHAEEIKSGLHEALRTLSEDEASADSALNAATAIVGKLAKFSPALKEQKARLENVLIELEDICGELAHADAEIEFEPERLQQVHDRLAEMFTLQKRHQVNTVAELIAIHADLQAKLAVSAESEFEIENLRKQVQEVEDQVEDLAVQLREKRLNALPVFSEKVLSGIQALGMAKADFKVRLNEKPECGVTGKDEIDFLFSANPGVPLSAAEKTASGGELSRLMLSLKSLVAGSGRLPTIIFDEIDTGVSGAVAEQMGTIMRGMGDSMQIFAITHLPQVAGKGGHHYRVSKSEESGKTVTKIQNLSGAERVEELASMLSGEEVTKSAFAHAKHLLGDQQQMEE